MKQKWMLPSSLMTSCSECTSGVSLIKVRLYWATFSPGDSHDCYVFPKPSVAMAMATSHLR